MAKSEAASLKNGILWLNFQKSKTICMEKVVEDQSLTLQQHFPYKSSKFSEKSYDLLFDSGGLKLNHFGMFGYSP